MRNRLTSYFAAAGLLLYAEGASAQLHEYDEWNENYTIQALLGVVYHDHLKLAIEDSTEPKEIDLSALPQLGGAWSTLPQESRIQYGLEASFLMGFRADKLRYLYLGGGGARVRMDVSLWTFDLAGGAYLNLFLDPGRNLRVYAAGGPLLMYADYNADRDYENDALDDDLDETAFGTGIYARGGIEFRLHERATLGLGVRGSWARLDLSNVGGKKDLNGLAVFAGYTVGF